MALVIFLPFLWPLVHFPNLLWECWEIPFGEQNSFFFICKRASSRAPCSMTVLYSLPRRFSCCFLYRGLSHTISNAPKLGLFHSPSAWWACMGSGPLQCRKEFLLFPFSFTALGQILSSSQPCGIQVLCPDSGASFKKQPNEGQWCQQPAAGARQTSEVAVAIPAQGLNDNDCPSGCCMHWYFCSWGVQGLLGKEKITL